MRGDVEINVEDGSVAATGEGKQPTATSKLVVQCRFPYLTIKEDDELPKRYRKARHFFVFCWGRTMLFFSSRISFDRALRSLRRVR